MALTASEVAQGLHEVYRHRESAESAIADVSLLTSGFEADVFVFSLQPANDREEIQNSVLRLYAGEETAQKAAREFAVMRRLHDVGYPVPAVHLVDHTTDSPFGRPFLIMERIPGVSMGSTYWSASEDQLPALQVTLFQLMHRLHQLDPTTVLPESPQADLLAPEAGLGSELSALTELVDRLETHAPPSLHKVLAWLDSRRATVSTERLSVVHGDFHPNNVLLRADGAAIVIDWSNVRLSDYRMDMAWTRIITLAHDRPDRGETELRLYAQFAGNPIRDIAYFEVIACIRILTSVLISLRFGAARMGMRPEAATRMQHDVAFTRYVAALLQSLTAMAMPDLEEALFGDMAC
ncbi:MAG: phosphotransferase enzyme family [Chthonomonadaceae bacterium]|nr:phosphotransferase enzyme family [Chthonomonadaceae bacterium]